MEPCLIIVAVYQLLYTQKYPHCLLPSNLREKEISLYIRLGETR